MNTKNLHFLVFLWFFFSSTVVGRWSQETGSDNEIHPHVTSSPNPLPLPHPDLTDTSYMNRPPHNQMGVPSPSMLENMHENYNIRANPAQMIYDNDRYKYEMDHDNVYGQNTKDYQANYSAGGSIVGIADTAYNLNSNYHAKSSDTRYTASAAQGVLSDTEYPNNQIINQMIPQHSNHFLYDKQRSPYMGSKTELPYMSKDRLSNNMYSPTPRESHYGLKSPGLYSGAESVHSVHSMLKNDYQVNFENCSGLLCSAIPAFVLTFFVGFFLFFLHSNVPPTTIVIECLKHPIKMDIIFHTLPKRII